MRGESLSVVNGNTGERGELFKDDFRKLSNRL